MSTQKTGINIYKLVTIIVIFFTLLLIPAPLLPPHNLAEIIESILGTNWQLSYLVAAVGLQIVFFISIGLLSASVVKRAPTLRGRLIQIIFVPLAIVLIALMIRSVKAGHFPIWINAAIPMLACLAGVWLGLGLLYRRGKSLLFIMVAVIFASLWFLKGGAPAALSRLTEIQLKRLVSSGAGIPSGEAKFGELIKIAFTPLPDKLEKASAVEQNRAAILALGIALGGERLSKFVGLQPDSKLVQEAILLREGITLREREDWSRHFTLSAALAVLEHPLVSDAGGLMKEQMDALTGGSGFSFCDFAADRAGVRFAIAATNSEEDAKAMQQFLMNSFLVDNFFPPVADLPENLTTEQFRKIYGRVGTETYRLKINEIESRLDNCIALFPLHAGKK